MSLPENIHRWLRIPYMLHIERRGKRGPLVILIHGLASRGDIWDETVAELARDHRCVTIHLLGHGASPKPTKLLYDTTDHERSLAWTLFWRGLWGKKIIVSHSMGGLISIRYAAKHPRRLDRLVLVGLPLYRRSEAAAESKKFEASLDKGFLVFYKAMRALPKSAAIMSSRALMRIMPRLNGSTYLDEETWYPAVSSLAHTIEEQTALVDLESIPAELPITMIYGRLDQFVLTSNLRLVKKKRPTTKLVPVVSYHEISHKTVRPVVRAVSQRIHHTTA